ncbi:hypothetical protein theurythT_29160 [Thalassotalea eurytherma]|uniref:Uncharacterized protein n=2 Tax=Thalassotalea eurytherma TaxID=1144278 RepID=A0ABQ6H5M9_9GAMM|nr:hypothetical protein theurythT_29160 [Thalassotalea eurytherma]
MRVWDKGMNQQRITRMNTLFEKVLSGNASRDEQMELKLLYKHYINFGRESHQNFNHQPQQVVGHYEY